MAKGRDRKRGVGAVLERRWAGELFRGAGSAFRVAPGLSSTVARIADPGAAINGRGYRGTKGAGAGVCISLFGALAFHISGLSASPSWS